jgi:alpha,alpha-trehalase
MDYGIVGNCKTCALINKKGSVDWFCFPNFDDSSVFAKILDEQKGGSFEILSKGKYSTSQKYVENTNILETIFKSGKDSFKIIDFFPRYQKIAPARMKKLVEHNKLVRIIMPLSGTPLIKVIYNPKLNYASQETFLFHMGGEFVAQSRYREISMVTNCSKENINAEYFGLKKSMYFVIGEYNSTKFSMKKCLSMLHWTKKYWEKWVSTLVIPKRNRDLIIRSALALKLLTFSETGAIIAAPTTSIPEEIGSERTWDYRYCWIRDATMAADAFKKIGRNWESKRLLEFIIKHSWSEKKHLQIMYGIEGDHKLDEKILGHLAGYKGSRPVRIGNAAYDQKQYDIYGELLDTIYLYYVYYEYEKHVTRKMWRFINYLLKQIKVTWRKKDNGIWEFRNIKEHMVYSKLMCFVGVDRAIKIAQRYGNENLIKRWLPLRDNIKNEIINKGFSRKKNSFTMFYGSNYLDASLLLMTYHGFVTKDPRVVSTVKRINKDLRKDYLVQRYKMNDDFGKSKSAFTICTFWLIDALYSIGEVNLAQNIFSKIIKKSNHLGLFSEDIDIKSGKLRGNFPQAYTHIALINSSILLSEWSSRRKKIDWNIVAFRII